MKAIVLGAGKGTRMKSKKPKVLHPLLGKPMIWYVLSTLRQAGLEDIALVVGYGAEEVKKEVGDQVTYFFQENPAGGTADAVLSAIEFWRTYEGYILITNGDSPLVSPQTLRGIQRFIHMVEEYEKIKLSGVVLYASLPDPTGYGRVIFEEGSDRIVKIVEEKDATPQERGVNTVNAGVYVFWAPHLLEAIFKIKPSPVTGELYITDAVNILSEKGYEVRGFMASDPSEILGVNDRWDLAVAENLLRLKLIKYWSQRGVTFRNPETIWIEPDVDLSPEVEVRQGAVLKGKTKVEKGVLIGEGVVLENSTVEEGARILPYSVVESSTIKAGAIVGPFARLRNNTVVGESAEVGNFVEVKNSTLGKEVKAKHLSYIGDATVGDRVNVGAGVVFANFDGKKKYHTVVEEGAFIGSNSLLIAPIKVGKLAYIAGGSAVSKDVPEGTLAVERARLRIVKDKGKQKLL